MTTSRWEKVKQLYNNFVKYIFTNEGDRDNILKAHALVCPRGETICSKDEFGSNIYPKTNNDKVAPSKTEK